MEGFRPISWVMTYDDDTAATVGQLREINDASQNFCCCGKAPWSSACKRLCSRQAA